MNHQRRAAVLAAAIVLVLAAGAAVAEQPLFRVEEPEIDVGTVVAGATATATFVFRNDGPTDVNIIRAKPS